jgi:hypothetical protein
MEVVAWQNSCQQFSKKREMMEVGEWYFDEGGGA